MNYYCIADEETVRGFRLAGIAGQVVTTAQQAAEAAENTRREANKRHRTKINNAARDALVAAGLTAEQATVAVTAIAAGNVPNVKISY